uniref:protein LEAD-SENSITIVE 1-like n=1 Tax=Erigeron canadensis TaxID=72917 RepID=UPI001CB97723|nr:protein LEAD-SENSITIVE 1-like [Erigeron canadensis]
MYDNSILDTGIYVGENKVVHFTAPENKSGVGWNLPFSSSYTYLSASCLNSLGPEFSHPKSGRNDSSSLNFSPCARCLSSNQTLQASCLSKASRLIVTKVLRLIGYVTPDLVLSCKCAAFPDCGFKLANSGVVISCLNCFIGTGNLYLYQYGVTTAEYFSKVRGGTCTIAQSDPPQEVIHRATYLLQNNVFGDYHVVRNNCEDFALYCKTGLLISGRPTTGSSGQVNMVSNAPWKSIITSTLPKLVFNSSVVGVVTVLASTGIYYYRRYKTDIGVRDDVVKVEVEDIAFFRAEACQAVNCG